MHSADCAVARCLSVTRQYSVETVQHIIILFSPSARHTILDLVVPNIMTNSDGDSPNGGVECSGYEKIAVFDQYLTISQKRYKIHAHSYYEMRIGNQAYKWYRFQ